MAEHTLYGKRRICYTEVTEFTDFQGVGRDPLYKRYDTVNSVIEKYISPEYRDFLAHPIYSDEDQILWYVRDWNGSPSRFKDLTGKRRRLQDAVSLSPSSSVSFPRAKALQVLRRRNIR